MHYILEFPHVSRPSVSGQDRDRLFTEPFVPEHGIAFGSKLDQEGDVFSSFPGEGE